MIGGTYKLTTKDQQKIAQKAQNFAKFTDTTCNNVVCKDTVTLSTGEEVKFQSEWGNCETYAPGQINSPYCRTDPLDKHIGTELTALDHCSSCLKDMDLATYKRCCEKIESSKDLDPFAFQSGKIVSHTVTTKMPGEGKYKDYAEVAIVDVETIDKGSLNSQYQNCEGEGFKSDSCKNIKAEVQERKNLCETYQDDPYYDGNFGCNHLEANGLCDSILVVGDSEKGEANKTVKDMCAKTCNKEKCK